MEVAKAHRIPFGSRLIGFTISVASVAAVAAKQGSPLAFVYTVMFKGFDELSKVIFRVIRFMQSDLGLA